MNLGLFLAIGESLKDLEEKGQLKRLLNYNVKGYSLVFEKVYLFSYANEKYPLPKNCFLIANKTGLHRYLYALLLPIIQHKIIRQCNITRGLQITGGIPAAVAKIIFGKKFVVNYGYDYPSFAKIEEKYFQSFLYKILEKPLIKLADAVIVTSVDIKKNIDKITSLPKIFYIPNGVDLKLFKPYPRRKSKSGILKIVYLGRLEKQKNLDNLIRAISLLKSKIELSFYGRGSQKHGLLALARRLKVNLKIASPVDYERVPQLLSKFHIFVLPSQEEGNPKALLEAMACQLPTVASNVKGIRELIKDGETGILCSTAQESIAKAINRLEDKSTREKIGKAARVYVMSNFNLDYLLTQETRLLQKTARK